MLALSEEEVRSRLDAGALISALELAFRDRYDSTVMPPRTHLQLAGGIFLAMPCYDRAGDVLGMKLVMVHPNGEAHSSVEATYMLLDPETSRPKLMIAANHLTDVRTAATSAMATKFLARADVKTLGIFGTGRLARAHLTALPLVRSFERVLICGRSQGATQEFIVASSSNLMLQPASADECAAESDVICTCTTSSEPLFKGNMLRLGTHLNLVGAFQPHTREVDSLAIKRARLFVDTYDGVLSEAGDVLIPLKEGVINREDIAGDLHELVSGTRRRRNNDDDITVFKSVGCALEDLVAAEVLMSS